jgi:transcription termination factor Rho
VLPVNAAAFSQPTVSLSHLQQAAAQHQAAAVAAGRMQQQQQTQAVNAVMQQQQQQKNQRAFVGIVTKMQDNYGFVDDDVFFQVK